MKLKSYMRPLSWKSIAIICVGTGITLFTINGPHVYFLEEQRKKHGYVKEGIEVPVSNHMNVISASVIKDFGLSEKMTSGISFYTSKTNKFVKHGCLYDSKYFTSVRKAEIGMPLYFNWSTFKDLEDELNIEEDDFPIDWSSEAGKLLRMTFFPSKPARKFAIANEIATLQLPELLYKSLIMTVLVPFFLMIVPKRPIKSKNLFITRFLYPAAIFFSQFFLVFYTFNYIRLRTDEVADENVAKLGPEYVAGGEEMMENIMMRNRILRDFALVAGHSKTSDRYTDKGEEQAYEFGYRTLNERRLFFKKIRLQNENKEAEQNKTDKA